MLIVNTCHFLSCLDSLKDAGQQPSPGSRYHRSVRDGPKYSGGVQSSPANPATLQQALEHQGLGIPGVLGPAPWIPRDDCAGVSLLPHTGASPAALSPLPPETSHIRGGWEMGLLPRPH